MGKKGHILGGGGYVVDGAPRYVLVVLDLDAAAPQAELIPVPFLPHGLAIDPRDRFRAAVFEKKGPGAAIVDLRTRTVVEPIVTPPGRRFYGHGAFSADGSLLYATESLVDRDFAGVLCVRDAQTLKELGKVPTYGAAPHDCQLIDEGKTMVVANGGGPVQGARPCISYVELAGEKLLEKIELDSPHFNAGHIALTGDRDLALVSAPRDGLQDINKQLGAVSLRSQGGALSTMREPSAVVRRMLGETLSVTIDDNRTVLATHPLGNCVSRWRLDDGAFLGTLEMSGPRGVTMTLDREWLVVSHIAGRSVRLSAFSAQTHESVDFFVDPSYASGSHIFAHDLAA